MSQKGQFNELEVHIVESLLIELVRWKQLKETHRLGLLRRGAEVLNQSSFVGL